VKPPRELSLAIPFSYRVFFKAVCEILIKTKKSFTIAVSKFGRSSIGTEKLFRKFTAGCGVGAAAMWGIFCNHLLHSLCPFTRRLKKIPHIAFSLNEKFPR
jgi:hypothetical protein